MYTLEKQKMSPYRSTAVRMIAFVVLLVCFVGTGLYHRDSTNAEVEVSVEADKKVGGNVSN